MISDWPKNWNFILFNLFHNDLLQTWVCPPCKGYCNCSVCLSKKGKAPTGVLHPFARDRGFHSVKDYLARSVLFDIKYIDDSWVVIVTIRRYIIFTGHTIKHQTSMVVKLDLVTRLPILVTKLPILVTRLPILVTWLPILVTRLPILVTKLPIGHLQQDVVSRFDFF